MAPPDRSDDGATAVEYALMVLLIATVLISVVGLLGLDVLGLFAGVCGGAGPFAC
jgi:pilus assembly protein Flp/PilA